MNQIHETAHIGEYVTLGDGIVIGPHAMIDGEGSPILIGDRCVIGPGTCIGQAGFGYALEDGELVFKPHPFGVMIGNDVHVGSNTCIDRGSWRNTQIQAGTKIDNLVHIAHNVIIGRNCLVIAHAELSGSVVLGEHAYIAPGAVVRERLVIGAHSVVGMGAVVTKDVAEGLTVAGVPARVIGTADGPPPPPKGRE